jgi:hypothetical protein
VFVHLHHPAAGALHLHSAAARSAGRSRADGKDWIFDIDTSVERSACQLPEWPGRQCPVA